MHLIRRPFWWPRRCAGAIPTASPDVACPGLLVLRKPLDAAIGQLLATYCPSSCQGNCWVRYTHCSDYKARGASGDYEAQGASGNYKARGASGRKYKARMVIFCILAVINRFSWISRKEESCWGKLESRWGKLESRWRKREAAEESGKPLKKAESRWRKRKAVEESRKSIGENRILCEENWILGEGNLDIGEGFHNVSERFSSIGDSFPTCNW